MTWVEVPQVSVCDLSQLRLRNTRLALTKRLQEIKQQQIELQLGAQMKEREQVSCCAQ